MIEAIILGGALAFFAVAVTMMNPRPIGRPKGGGAPQSALTCGTTSTYNRFGLGNIKESKKDT